MRVRQLLIPGLALAMLSGPSAALAAGGTGLPSAPKSTTSTTRSASTKASTKKHATKKKKAKKVKAPSPANTNYTAADTPGTGGASMGAPGSSSGSAGGTGTSTPSTPSHPTVPGDQAKIVNGLAYAPADAPIQVQKAIWAGDAIRHKPYVFGGGHGKWNDTGYDCSGSVSYVLHAAGLIKTSMDSSDFETWGQSGLGEWITVYTNPGHAFVQIAGIRLDTSAEQDPNPSSGSGPRWRPVMNSTSGFQARHPANF